MHAQIYGQAASMDTPHSWLAPAVINGSIYVAGGQVREVSNRERSLIQSEIHDQTLQTGFMSDQVARVLL